MIRIPGASEQQIADLPGSGLQNEIVRQRMSSPVTYRYPSLDALRFELIMRENIVRAAEELYEGEARFAVFARSRCNERLWYRTRNGGFQLRPEVSPSYAITDIFRNGQLYAFECATAMMIILYKAVLETIGREKFDTYFKDLYVRDWHYDSDLQLVTSYDPDEATFGDILYFENPDHHPATPEWQGENVIMVAPNRFFGHGVGIRSAEGMIDSLNRRRFPGSRRSAYLSDQVNYPNFEHLRNIATRDAVPMLAYLQGDVIARIGSHGYEYHLKKRA